MNRKDFLIELEKHNDLGNVKIEEDSEPYFVFLENNFPMKGSKIAWSQVDEAYETYLGMDIADEEKVKRVLERLIENYQLLDTQTLTILSDSVFDFAVKTSIDFFIKDLVLFLQIPQHLYVLVNNEGICISITMEGWIAFGKCPS